MARQSKKDKNASQRSSGRLNANRLGIGSATRDTVLHGDGVYREVSATGGDHASSHENGGGDEISVTGLSGLLADDQNPTAHASDHENGGVDEIDVTGLSGLLADEQDPLDHATDHEAGGGDPIQLDDLAAPSDNTDLDASTTAHGLLPKLPAANSGTVFQGDGTWAYASAFIGDVMFGKGSGGSLTLVANTSMTNSAFTVQALFYTTIDISTYTWSSSDPVVFIYASTSITGNGGIIDFLPTDAGIAGGVGASGGGSGGTSGESGYYFRCFAKEFIGTGTVRANGGAGVNGNNATAATVTGNGNAGANATNAPSFRGVAIGISGSVTAGGGGQSAGTGGSAGNGTGATVADNLQLFKDPAFFFLSDEFVNVVSSGIHNTTPTVSDGAGAGGRNTGAQGGGGGGSSGSGFGFFATSVAGSQGGAGGAGAAGSGGGGGGAGAPGSCLAIMCRKTASTWTFAARGGNGGNGGNGFGNGGGGAGGPGGGGGYVKCAVGYGSPTPTLSAAGGTHGNKGLHGAGGGNDGADGNDGNAGLTELYVF